MNTLYDKKAEWLNEIKHIQEKKHRNRLAYGRMVLKLFIHFYL